MPGSTGSRSLLVVTKSTEVCFEAAPILCNWYFLVGQLMPQNIVEDAQAFLKEESVEL